MKKNFFTFFVVGLLVMMSGSVSAQSYGFNAEKAAYMLNGDFLTDPALDSAYIGAVNGAVVTTITSGDADSVYFGKESVHAVFTNDPAGKDRLEFKMKTAADMHMFNSGILTFWVKLNDTLDMYFEVNADRNSGGEVKGSDASMAEFFGLDRFNDSAWQMITIDLAKNIKNDFFDYTMFESFGFRSRGNACDFFIDEMHVEYYGAYGINADRIGWMTDGDFLTDPDLGGPFFGPDKTATVRMITSGNPDSVMFGQNAIYVNLTDNPEGKDRLLIKVDQDADFSQWNYGTLVFYLKLLAPTKDINFEVSANRNGVGEAKGTDLSMLENYGLDTSAAAVGVWQKFEIELSEPIKSDNFSYDVFESFSFRNKGNASEFIMDEMHVILRGAYSMNADKLAYRGEGDFLTDPMLVGATIGPDKTATVTMITSGDADSVYFGMNAVHVVLTDNPEGKDRLLYKVDQDADMTFFNNGMLIFWIKLLSPTTDINFEMSANRNGAGEAKGSDISMKDNLGLDVNNDSSWQKITVDLSRSLGSDNFTYDIFESLGFRSKGNASEFIIDEMHVKISSPLARYAPPASDVATLDTLTVSVGDLTPAFNPETMAYTLEAPPGTLTVTVAALATDANATVEGTGDVDLSAGTATATVTVTAEDGVTKKEYVIQMTRSTVSVEDNKLSGISVYPNPVSTQLTVEFGDHEVNRVDVVNLLGQKVISRAVQGQRMVFNVSDLSEGIYVVALDGVPYSKIVIRK